MAMEVRGGNAHVGWSVLTNKMESTSAVEKHAPAVVVPAVVVLLRLMPVRAL